MGAIWGAVAAAAISAGVGVYQNSRAESANEEATQQSRADYEARVKAAGKAAAEMLKQYNEVVEQRPGTDWNTFARNYIRALDDPSLREAYANAKDEDFAKMREFAEAASEDNVDTLLETFDRLNGGRGQEVLDERTRMVLDIDASDRYARAYELAAPIRTNPSTVRYDTTGRLVEGQRADKQAFDIAQEVITETDRERLANITQLENDRLRASESQQEKALDFLSFYDSTGFATALEDQRSSREFALQAIDEQRAWDLFSSFAQGATGMQPVQPNLQSTTAGNELISQGVRLAAGAYSDYQKGQSKKTY